MKKIISLLLAAVFVSLFCVSASAAGKLYAKFDVRGKDATESLKASDIDCVEISNIKIAEFDNGEGNIIAAAENKKPSWFTFKLSAEDGYVLDGLLIKTYASVNAWNDVENDFGLYISTTQKIDYAKASRIASGMIGKKNHRWTADDAIPEGATEIYVSVYFVNNSNFVDWIRFYDFELTATQSKKQVETEPPATEPADLTSEENVSTEPLTSEPVTEPADITSEEPVSSEAPVTESEEPGGETKAPETSGKDSEGTVTTDAETKDSGKSAGTNNIVPIIIIAAAAIVLVIATVALIAILKKK